MTFAMYATPARGDSHETTSADGRPNILLIFIDDMGYADPGCYGSPLPETPNIDRLAASGVRFTNGYAAAPICSASRAGLLTGRSPARLGLEFVTTYEDNNPTPEQWSEKYADYPLIPPSQTKNLPLTERTIAEQLADAGYTTAMTGKWHVAAHHDGYLSWSPTHGPAQQGFQWTADTKGSHPYGYPKNERGKLGPFKQGEYPEDELTQQAISFIQREHDKPFFLYVSHYYVHDPLDTKCGWLLDKYRAKAGPDVSDQRVLYAAFVDTMDHYVGQLLDGLEASGQAHNTLVVLTSDNGGHPEHAWNRPLRGSKWNLYEGGVRVPFIVRWPGVNQAGTTCDVPVINTDLLPTFMAAAQHQPDNDRDYDGRSILPLIKGKPTPDALANRPLFWHFPWYHWRESTDPTLPVGIEDGYISLTHPQSSIRKGRYKLIYFYEDKNVELYDLENDVAEQHDLSAEKPELAEALKQELLTYLESVHARYPTTHEALLKQN
ncbi:MAG: sulfatase [Phycisphaerales bacterium]